MALHPNPVPQRQGWFPVSLCLSDPTRALLFASAGPCPMAAAPGVSAQGPWKRQGGTESQDGEGPSLRPARPGQQLPPSIPRDSSTGSGRRRKLPPSCPSRRGDGRAVAESAAEGPRALRALALPGRRSGLKARVLRKPHNAPRPRPRTGGGAGGHGSASASLFLANVLPMTTLAMPLGKAADVRIRFWKGITQIHFQAEHKTAPGR